MSPFFAPKIVVQCGGVLINWRGGVSRYLNFRSMGGIIVGNRVVNYPRNGVWGPRTIRERRVISRQCVDV